jgi:creatinine amidohydrolase
MARDPRLMADLTWQEFRDRASSTIALLPLGAVEQHGPHLPLDTDTVVPNALCLRVAGFVPALVVPPLAYGYKSQPTTGGGGTFPGTTNFDGATFTACVRDIVRELLRQGVRAIALINGNYENSYFAIEGIDLAIRDAGTPADARVLMVNWWEQLTADDLDAIFHGAFPGWEAEHAGVVETSLMLHLDPQRVEMERLPPASDRPLPAYTVLPEPPGRVPASGVLRDAHGASAEIGASVADRLVARIVELLRAEFPAIAGS